MWIQRLETIGKTFQHLQRARTIVRVFLKYGYEDLAQTLHLPSALGIPIRRIREEQQKLKHLPQAQRFRMACEELGPTFVKMGQALSTRPDLMPPPFLAELEHLQDEVGAIEFSAVCSMIEAELEAPLDTLVASIEEKPLAAASIAQVHKAVLKNGQTVVMKVQRPDIKEIIRIDLEILHYLAHLIERNIESWRLHQPSKIVEELAKTLNKELDFTIEAGHCDRFAWQFADDPSIYVPRTFHHLSTVRVLTMEHVQGIKVSELSRLKAANMDCPLMAQRLANLAMRQIFEFGFFHADPHPGNIHILSNQVICFLDFGMMGYLDHRRRSAFADMVWGIARRNEITVTNAMVKLAVTQQEPQRQGLESDVAEFMHQNFYRPIGEVEFGKLMGRLLQLTTRHGLRIPPDFFNMLKALSQTEAVVRTLHPQHDMIRQAAPFLRKVRVERLHPKRMTEGLFELTMEMSEFARELPVELRGILSQVKTGQARIVFRHEGLDPLITSGDRISNRIAFSVVLAALIIGSSLIVLADVPPKWHEIPVIGLIGYVLAALMGFWLLISILRHGRI